MVWFGSVRFGVHVYVMWVHVSSRVCIFMYVRVHINTVLTHMCWTLHMCIILNRVTHQHWSDAIQNQPTDRYMQSDERPIHIYTDTRIYTFALFLFFFFVFFVCFFILSYAVALVYSHFLNYSHTNACVNVYVCLSVNIKCPIQKESEREKVADASIRTMYADYKKKTFIILFQIYSTKPVHNNDRLAILCMILFSSIFELILFIF